MEWANGNSLSLSSKQRLDIVMKGPKGFNCCKAKMKSLETKIAEMQAILNAAVFLSCLSFLSRERHQTPRIKRVDVQARVCKAQAHPSYIDLKLVKTTWHIGFTTKLQTIPVGRMLRDIQKLYTVLVLTPNSPGSLEGGAWSYEICWCSAATPAKLSRSWRVSQPWLLSIVFANWKINGRLFLHMQ